MQIDRNAVERFAPIRECAIVVGMRDRDRLQSTERADMRDRLRCCQRDAVPHHVTIIQRNQQRALADRKARLERDAGEAEIVTPDEAVTFGERLGREEGLALPVHELPLVLADRAGCWRICADRKLGAAGFAGPEGHGGSSIAGCSTLLPQARHSERCDAIQRCVRRLTETPPRSCRSARSAASAAAHPAPHRSRTRGRSPAATRCVRSPRSSPRTCGGCRRRGR